MSKFTKEQIEEETRRRNEAISERDLRTREADQIRWRENAQREQRKEDDKMMANFYRVTNR